MKQQTFRRQLWLQLLMLLIPLGAWADREVLQPQFGKQTITVASDEVITFYDPWGTEIIDDQNSYNSQSLTVFRPAEAGKSVQITFEKIDLNQYSLSYYLYLNIYDGVADADDAFTWPTSASSIGSTSSLTGMSGTLIAEKINNSNKPTMPAVYTSGTADGALSIGFMHRNSNECEGWVAKVKVVTLENMTVTGAGSNYDGVVTQPQAKTGLAFANAFVTATGVLNADHVTGIHFTMTQNEGAVDPTALKLFKGDTQLTAAVETDGDNYKFVLDEALSDGTNTFTIKGDFLGTADVAAKAKIDITKITTTEQPEGVTPFTPGTSIAVENPALVFMSATPQTISVGSTPLTFYDEGGADGKYINDQNDRTITFTPKNEDKVVQIDFSKFDIYYSSWSTPAQFKVYSGTSASGTLLWEPTAQADYTTGPDKTLRGIPADGGAITIVFNAKTTSTYSVKDGWAATVSEYQPVQMVATAIEATQTKTTDASIGGMNEALLTFNVQTEGSLNALSLTAVNIDLKGTNTQIDKLYLYSVGETDKEPTATAVGNVEVSGATATLTLTDAVTLNEGNNYFRLTADVKESVLPETTIDAAITSIVASEQTINATAGDPEGQRTLKDMILMSSTGNTITVLEGRPIAFYDEGGAEGGIVSKTNGKTTFLSGDADKKVMVDFTTNEIWHGSLYNQELRIYAGQEVKAENLIKTLQQGEKGIVRSTAEDGSLTVVLYSDASNDVAANGWEATVSLFTPQPMTIDELTIEAVSTETVCASDIEQDMLAIDVNTVNTEPAMQVKAMAFNVTNATKAALYFGATKVGEGTVGEGGAVNITLTTPQSLVEGSNIFTLKLDISDDVINDQTVTAQLTSVIVTENNAEKTESVTTEAKSRTVKNIVLNHADQGTVTKTVNGSLAFETKPTSEYSSKYEYGTDTRTNIFVPKHAGMVCQIDFSSFNVYYASSSYGEKAKFAIYAGQGTTGDKLWELNDNAQQNVGPSAVIRSTAEDGSLTVVFSPNTSSSYYTGNGWKATVSEYQTKDMEVKETEVTQASTADASIGAANQELLTVNVKTEGNLNPLAMGGMKLNLNGTEANISKVSVWQNETKLGEATAAAEVDVTFSEAVSLTEGNNLFTVKADISEDAVENQTIDAKVISVKVGSDDVAVASGDPEGTRTLKNQVLMTAGDHGTLNLGLGKTVAIYDDGGANGDGADGVEATITLSPSGEADCIKLTCQDISFAYTAYLYIYEGSEVNDEKLLIDNRGATKPFSPIIVSGPVTIKYVGKGSYTKPNFAVQAEGYKKTDVVVTGVTTEDISVSEVLKGQTDVKMLKVMVEAKGELTPAKITAFNITGTDGEAVNDYHIYQTGTTTTFSANTAFETEYEITNSGTYYFWVTYDVKTDATVGLTASATLSSITVGEETINVTEPATATITVAEGKSGTYTVGQDGDYATIQGAVDDLGRLGMEGPVTLQIKAGEYNEKVRIPYIKGMGAVNTLTLESESGQRDVKIYHNQYTTGDYSDDQYSKVYGVVTLFEASYVTLKNLEIYTTDVIYDAVVMVKNESRHVTIDNCYLHAPFTATNQQDINLVDHYAQDVENRNNDYLTVKDCLLEGGWMGIKMGGTGYVALPKEVGGIIEGNTFKNQRSKAIQALDELGIKIRNNNILIDGSVGFTGSSVGILDIQVRDEYSDPTEITGNTFNINASYYCPVINIRQMEAKTDAPAIIANNVINQASLNASYSAFKFNGANIKNVNVAHNTFRMTGTNGGAAFWASSALANGYGNVNVVNNIIQNETSGYAVNLYSDANLSTENINFQNNVMYTAGETFFRAASSTSGDFDAFVTATSATECVNKQVNFLSDDILEPADDLEGDLRTAVALDYVTTDITGKARPTENITIGAYEYDPNAQNAPVMAEDYPKVITHLDGNASFAVKTDLAATVYYLVKKSDEDAPTAAALQEAETKKDVAANAEAVITVEGLEDEAEYIAYFLPVSLRGVASDIVSQTAAFHMDVTPPVTDEPVAEVYINNSDTEETVPVGSEVTLMAMVLVDERTAPYTLTWMDSEHNVLKTETFESADDIDALFTTTTRPYECTDYIFLVTDAAEKADTATVRAIVTSENIIPATFENLYLEEESWENGKNLNGSFVSGSFKFDNFYSPDYGGYWGNYGYANRTSTTFENMISDQFNNAVGGGVNGSENYMVAYPSSWYGSNVITVMNKPEGDVISGFYVTNDAWVVDNIVNGDGMSDDDGAPFGMGDYLKLTITADNSNSVDFYLADFRSNDESKHYYLDSWEWVDLTSLGTVKTLSFTLTGTKKNSYGLTTAAYFCMDDLGGTAPIPVGLPVIKGATDESGIEGYYDLNGRKLSTPQHGVNIVKMKNGTTRKIIMK